MLELHIWGPSFTLPSISPQSLSAIAYLKLTQPPTAWTLIPSSNPLLSPSRELPALRDGTIWVPGFRGIIEYLRHKNGRALDDVLGREERADALAFGTYIESVGGRLLDLSMYLTDENFDVLRGAFAKLLPVPARYYVPGVLRREARRRSDGLIPASSVSATDPTTPLPLPSAMTAAALPATREKILAKATAERIKQTAIAANFLQAIQTRLGKGEYFFGDKPSSLDCLAVGYLSLGLYAELPNGWLREEMLTQHGQLCTYVNGVRGHMLGDGVDVVAVMSGQATVTTSSGQVVDGGLPWGIVEPQYVPQVTRFLLNRAMEMVGITSTGRDGSVRGEEEQTQEKKEHEKGMKSLQRWETAKNMAVVVGCIGTFIGYCVWNGLITMELGGRGKDKVAGGVTGGIGGRDDDGEKDAENEMELLEGFGSAEAILGLGDEVNKAFVRGVNEEEREGKGGFNQKSSESLA
ncbi:outer mitochondrial membrane transport complex protein-domain-containing protein [Tuber borchii]|uniref:Outer mitochondrial membrane transport complex protein-domain-containing protein n=1 Tax=Tuber borchii TaxID=42251 RepID=A0A2T6ZB06_TUBBO|nr:outer mitochondrial membrane transport complex protein-domain-containing protein [Tuber borchii]